MIGSLYRLSIEDRNVTGMIKYMISIHFLILQIIFKSLAISIANKKNLLLSPEQKHSYRFRKTDSTIHEKYGTHKILIKYTATLMLI